MAVRLTELGAKGLLLLAALLLAFLATSYSNLFFLLLVFCGTLGGLGLASGIANLRAVRRLELQVPAGPAGAPRPVRLRLAARRSVSDLVVTLGDAPGLTLPPVAHAAGDAPTTALLPAQPRGVHAVGVVQLASRYPFGLFEVRRWIPWPGEVVTYPEPDGPAAPTGRSLDQGTPPDPVGEVAGLRSFRTGDRVRDVHWRATARRGAPIVKELDAAPDTAPEIVIDRRVEAAQLERLLAAATAAVLAAAEGRGAHLLSQGFAAAVPAGQPPPPAVLRWLASAAILPPDAPPPVRWPQDQEPAHA
ncbi:MAG: DUF58 domain-containing protein [Planctomycetes bacterium]|nr:DUF58 domain-containing protein [Planctomycetota bacterium]